MKARTAGDVSTIVARFDRMPSSPIAPGALYIDPNSGNERFQLHRLVAISGNVLTFETFNSTHELPNVGDVISFRSWWTKRAMEAAIDRSAIWRRAAYPDDGSHEHCLFTWASIEAGSDEPEGYHSSHGWITVKAFEDFIRDDVYRIRSSVEAA